MILIYGIKLIELIKKLWKVTWDQWKYRNAILHDQNNLGQSAEEVNLNHKISSAYQECLYILPNDHQHSLFTRCVLYSV